MKDLSGCTALIVEDSQVQRDHVAGLLRETGFGSVLLAEDGIAALRALELQCGPVDLVLTDMDMPGMDGMELIQHLAQRRLAANLIAASANASRLSEAAQGMPTDTPTRLLATIPKPIRLEDLRTILENQEMLPRAQLAAAQEASASEVEEGLRQGEFVAWYKPRVALDSGRLAGIAVEARWHHPHRGVLTPHAFIDCIDTGPLAAALLQAVVVQAIAQMREWQEMGLALRLCLPLPPQVLFDMPHLNEIAAMLIDGGIKPGGVSFEVSEAVVAAGEPVLLHNLDRLSLRGFAVGARHCGRYEAGLRQYACCPLSELVLDSLFVNEAARRNNRRPLLEGLLDIAAQLDVATCCDGIEQEEDWRLLRDLGCTTGQGPLIGAPVPAVAFVGWYKENRQRLREQAAINGAAPPAAGTA
jgi:EAL domain-containing protein (putative c-di-GMP-specific phosphodiesterase class I)/AmiR/NasT family two-component response regulator